MSIEHNVSLQTTG